MKSDSSLVIKFSSRLLENYLVIVASRHIPMNLSKPIKKLRSKVRELYYRSYLKMDELTAKYIIPYIWSEILSPTLKAGDLVLLKHELTLKNYHGIVLTDPERVITEYGIFDSSSSVKHLVKIKWDYGNKSFDRYEYCENLKLISGAK